MESIKHFIAGGAIACMLIGGIAVAQNLEEVKVQASRGIETKIVGRTEHLVPIREVALSYGVSLKDVDLTTSAGAAEAEKRVNDAALVACKEIGRQYPAATPDDSKCAKAAADEAMGTVQNLIAAARKKAGK